MTSFNEEHRLAVLRSYQILDTPPEAAFDELTQAAAQICNAPMAAVSLVDEARQWFKARVGLGATETPRDVSFCDHAMWRSDLFVVPDAALDPLFADNALVTGEPHIRFYAGAAILSDEGAPLGALCVLDSAPRPEGLNPTQALVLRILANQVQAQLRLRAAAQEALRVMVRMRDLDMGRELALEAAKLGRFDINPVTGERFYDERANEMLGVTAEESLHRETVMAHVHPHDAPALRAAVDRVMDVDRRGPLRITFRVNHPSGERWISVVGRTLFNEGVCTRFMGVLDDVTETRQSEEQRRLLANELNHRVKNTLAVVQGLVESTLRSTLNAAEARAKISARIKALGAAHDILTASNWSAADLGQVVEREMNTLGLPPDRVMVVGPHVSLGPQPALQLALALHELATNALKYGALSNGEGLVEVVWSVQAGEGGAHIDLSWTERGGPPVTAPKRRGFGSQLIERVTAAAFSGKVDIDYRTTGLHWRLRAPLAGLAEVGRAEAHV